MNIIGQGRTISGSVQLDQQQIAVSDRTIRLINAVMKANEATPIDPNSSIQHSDMTDTGVGVQVDFTV
ncbi:MAG: hypothetical protein A2W23_01725 [Planctomycetes bacterium RBG_16_43_13]|nr:MAG: hypothetical protein A2W23_01725 [Planctomycetes bacterium RBG_16_43_13]